jgi:uncharacterized protein
LRRLVVDPNVLVSGIAGRLHSRPPALLTIAIEDEGFEAVVCPRLLSEVRRALRKPYFRKRVEEDAAAEALAMLTEACVMVENPAEVEAVLRDPNDDYLVALAREAGAEAIVSGDKDLLDHAGELEPRVLNAREACELLELI